MSVFKIFSSGGRDASLEPKEESELMYKIKLATDIESVREEFNILYKSLSNKLWGKLFKKFVPPFDTDSLKDVYQEGWRKVLEKRSNFNEGSNVYNWIYTIQHNTAIDVLRKEKNSENKFENSPGHNVNKDKSDDDFDIMKRLPDDNPGIEDEIDSRETVKIIFDAIEAITDETDKLLIKKRIIDGIKYGEIAEDTGIPIATVHYRIDKVLKELRPKLQKLLFD